MHYFRALESVIEYDKRRLSSEYYLHHGDCLDVMKMIPDESFDIIVTDPPYGISYQSNKRKPNAKFDVLKNDDNDSRFKAYREFHRLLKNDSVAVIFCSWKNVAVDYLEIEQLFKIKNIIVWDKGGGGIGDLKCSLFSDYELAIVAMKGRCQIRGKRIGSVWRFPKVNPSKMIHPTEKPIALFSQIIEKYTDPKAVVFDPYVGSGTTGVACANSDRRFFGIELDDKYYNIASERISGAFACAR